MSLPIASLAPLRIRSGKRSRLYRRQSRLRLRASAPLSVILASAITTLPLATDIPWVPPLGFMLFLGWRLLRPGLWPVWVGFPLGLVDDLFSGQPFGSGALIWSATMLLLDALDARLAWHSWKRDWAIAALLLLGAMAANALIAGLLFAFSSPAVLAPQAVLAVLGFPLVERLVAALDRWRTAA